MHIGLVTSAFPEPYPGRYPGIERLSEELTDVFLAQGQRVTVLTTFWNGGGAEGQHGAARIIRISDTTRVLGRWGSIGDAHDWSWGFGVGRVLETMDRADRPDVVHALSPVAATRSLVHSGFPVVTTFHHDEGLRGWMGLAHQPFHRILGSRAYLHSTLVTAPSRASAELMSDIYGVEPQRIRVVPWGVNLRRFQPSERAASFELRLLFIGPHESRKGLVSLLEALAALRRDGLVMRLTTAGAGSQLPDLRTLARDLGISEAVTFLGYLNDPGDAELRRLYAEADVFVLPSRMEGFGFVLAEAMASGLAIVTTNVSAMPEVVGDAAVLVPPGDPTALAKALRDLAGDPRRRLDLGLRGRKRVEAMFSWDQVATRLRSVYEEAADLAR